MDPRLEALLTGAGQAATGGWQDEAVSKLLAALPNSDDTGIPREYAGGSAEEQYKKQFRADAEDLQRRFPLNYAAGSIIGAAPAAIATGAMGGAPAIATGVGLGAVQGAGSSTSSGQGLIKDTVAGGALGGAGAAAGNLAMAAAPAAKDAIKALWKNGPPSGPAPALAGVGAPVAPKAAAPTGGPQINMSKSAAPDAVGTFTAAGAKDPKLKAEALTRISSAKSPQARLAAIEAADSQGLLSVAEARELRNQTPKPPPTKKTYIATDNVVPGEVQSGTLKSVAGVSRDPHINRTFQRRYLVEAPEQGVPINYSEPSNQPFEQGMKVLRRAALDGGFDADTRQLANELLPATSKGFLYDLGLPSLKDANINSAEDLSAALRGHYEQRLSDLNKNPQPGYKFSPGRLARMQENIEQLSPQWPQELQKEALRRLSKFKGEQENVVTGGMRLGPDSTITDTYTGDTFTLPEYLQTTGNSPDLQWSKQLDMSLPEARQETFPPVSRAAPTEPPPPNPNQLQLELSNSASMKPMQPSAEDLAARDLFNNQPPRQLGDFQQTGKTRTVDPAALENAKRQLAAVDPANHLGRGWARSVHDDQGQAAKIAMNPRGILQNEAEVNVWNSLPESARKNSVLNPVMSYEPDFSRVNQRLVEPLDTESMSKHVNMDPDTIEASLKQMAEPGFEGPQPTAPAQELQERMRRALSEVPEIDYRDVGKSSQWGLDKRGRPVLIDYGFLKGMPMAVAGGLGLNAMSDK